MYWLLLIIAGLFEVAFTFCLGKGKETQGTTMYLWYGGFESYYRAYEGSEEEEAPEGSGFLED